MVSVLVAKVVGSVTIGSFASAAVCSVSIALAPSTTVWLAALLACIHPIVPAGARTLTQSFSSGLVSSARCKTFNVSPPFNN